MSDDDSTERPEPLPVDGVLDLHTFRPQDIGDLIPDYLDVCLERGIHEVRIVHGKGTGSLRRGVHALLERLPQVREYQLAPEGRGSWGATIVQLAAEGAVEAPRRPQARGPDTTADDETIGGGGGGGAGRGDRRPPRRSALDPLRGLVGLALVCANTIVWGAPIMILAFAKLLVPLPAWRRACSSALTWMATTWVAGNNASVSLLYDISWEVHGLDGLDPRASCLVSANHQSWTDIVVLQRIFHRRIPFLRFFIKQELVWVPILGVAWWALDMPFMKRYSREYLARHPEKRGADMAATRRACARLRDVELSITNFLEGTRFTQSKHERQGGPYRHLLEPRAGGVGFALGALPDKLERMVDATVVYPDGAPTMWDFLCGRVRRIVVDVRVRDIPRELRGRDYGEDPAYRESLQEWLAGIWREKDERIDAIVSSSAGVAGGAGG